MHWCQIGKTLFEVWRDEDAPELTDTVCEAITHLKYYSGEFDIEWGRDVIEGADCPWHDKEQEQFRQWLVDNKLSPLDPKLSLGYLDLGYIEMQRSFGTNNPEAIWKLMSSYLNIESISINGHTRKYDYCWTDMDYVQRQINSL